MAIVAFENLSKVYELGSVQVFALRNLSLTIEKGQYIAIIGPSGSGKSTLLNILGCLDTPSSGKYHLAGQDVSSLDDNQLSKIRGLQLGFVFQSYNLIAQLSVVENIEVPMYYQGLSEHASAARAVRLAEMVGLGDRLKHKPAELSGGQQQRVAIARALANDPAVVLADEPTGNLDSASGVEILNLLTDLHQQGRTIVVVTHDEKIASRAQRVVSMIDGQVEKDSINGA
jgi:putative ABC transport system ATP-binding protein